MTVNLRSGRMALLERGRLLDSAWWVTLVMALASLVLSWTWGVRGASLTAGALAIALWAGLDAIALVGLRRLKRPRWIRRASLAVQACNILALSAVWHLAGGLSNPIFALLFIVPIVASGFLLLRWHPYALAVLASLGVAVVGLLELPDLRGALLQRDLSAGFGESTQSGLLVVTTFTAYAFAAAAISQSLASLLLRLYGRLVTASDELEEALALFRAVMTAEPEPGVVVDAASGEIIHANDAFRSRLSEVERDPVGRAVLEEVEFEDPQQVETLLAAERGEFDVCAYKLRGERRLATLRGYRAEHGGAAYVYLGLRDQTELHHLKALLEGLEAPLLAVGGDCELIYANAAARQVFPGALPGVDMLPVLSGSDPTDAEWRRSARVDGESFLRVGDHPYRVVAVPSSLPGEPNWATILTLHSVAEEERLYVASTRDALTGLHNRRYFEERLQAAIASTARGSRAAVALLDLDYFKQINDQLGHPVGDRALIHFVALVSEHLRANDLFARLGGDEFSVLFEGADAEAGRSVLDRVYARLPEAPLVAESESRVLSFSSGVGDLRPEDTIETVIARADGALYEAKQAGRGCCRIAASEVV